LAYDAPGAVALDQEQHLDVAVSAPFSVISAAAIATAMFPNT
jgi:hypothetical protein